MNEFEKMKAGKWYLPGKDAQLSKKWLHAKELCEQLNQTSITDKEKRQQLLEELLQQPLQQTTILSPFMVDYGENITLGSGCFINHNCYFMDDGLITLGDNVFVGPNVTLATPDHPLTVEVRNIPLERGLPIVIESNCWLGANVVVLPGVTIGEGCVVGAGSVVTHDLPANSLVYGVPATVKKTIDQESEQDLLDFAKEGNDHDGKTKE